MFAGFSSIFAIYITHAPNQEYHLRYIFYRNTRVFSSGTAELHLGSHADYT